MNDMYELDISGLMKAGEVGECVWTRLLATGEPPSEREMHCAAILTLPQPEPGSDESKHFLCVYGGRAGDGSVCDDVCVCDLSQLLWCTHERTNHFRCAAAGSTLGLTSLLVFGGWNGETTLYNNFLQLTLTGERGAYMCV